MLESYVNPDSSAICDEAYANMTLEERRRWNTARNQGNSAYLINILFPEGSLAKVNSDAVSTHRKSGLIDDVDVEASGKELLNKLIKQVPNRTVETGRILEYLSKYFFPAQPLLVYGPSGVGKSYLCELCLAQIRSCPVVCVDCRNFSSMKKLLGEIWRRAVEAVSGFNKRCFTRPTASDHLITSLKYPSSYDGLADRMSSLLECQAAVFRRYVTASTPLVPGIVLYLDNIDFADSIDAGLGLRLLNMKDLSHVMVKVVATQRSPPRSNEQCMLVCLSAYSDMQLLQIMSNRHTVEREKLHMNHNIKESESSTGHVEEDMAFSRLCEQAMPFVTLHSRHVDEVWAAVTAVWDRQQRRARRDRVRKRPRPGATATEGPGSGDGKRGEMKSSTEDDVAVIFHQPVPHCSNLFDGSIAPATAVKEMSGSFQSAVHSMDGGVPVITATMLGKGWCLDLSIMARVILLAAFLASRNPQDTDKTTFGNALKGRRKKARQGTEEGEGTKGDVHDQRGVPRAFGLERLMAIYIQILPAAGIARALTTSRDGDQVAKTAPVIAAGIDPLLTDNEALVYATINNLVRRKLLLVRYPAAKSSSYVDSSAIAMYLCAVDSDQAEMLARSASFPLRDYLCT